MLFGVNDEMHNKGHFSFMALSCKLQMKKDI